MSGVSDFLKDVPCVKCGEAKEESRSRSWLCRACEAQRKAEALAELPVCPTCRQPVRKHYQRRLTAEQRAALGMGTQEPRAHPGWPYEEVT